MDKGQWKITEEFQNFIDKLSKDNTLSKEDKILLIFEKICKDYVYDDNLISYIKKIDDDTYDLPDWYGRDIDSEWEKNREKHNRKKTEKNITGESVLNFLDILRRDYQNY